MTPDVKSHIAADFNSDGIVDMGAYEFVPQVPGDFNRDGFVNSADLSLFQACATGPGIKYDPSQLPQPSPGQASTAVMPGRAARSRFAEIPAWPH